MAPSGLEGHPRRTAIAIPTWRWRSVATTAIVLAAVFALSAGGGFLLEHEPAPDERRISIDREAPPPGPPEFRGGEVTGIGGGRIALRTAEGVIEFELGPGVSNEELRRVAEPRFAPGNTVNLGGEQSEFGLVLTGVVALDAANAGGSWP